MWHSVWKKKIQVEPVVLTEKLLNLLHFRNIYILAISFSNLQPKVKP